MGIGFGLVLLVAAAFVTFLGTRPERFRIERASLVRAPTDVVFALINDLREWRKWSPWEQLDPNMKRTYDGPSAGVGAIYTWAGNKKAGEGRMTITDSQPNDLITIELMFLKPFAATHQTSFNLTPTEGGTHVSWTMEGKNLLVSKAMSLVMNMDNLVGKDFERGLANLNAYVEVGSARPPGGGGVSAPRTSA